MLSLSSPIFHAMQAALGAAKHDIENGCIDKWNGWNDGIPIENFDLETRGYDNFYLELSKYAENLAMYYDSLMKINNGQDPDDLYDGVFSLAVSVAFGEWFALYVIEHSEAPKEPVALHAMQEIVDEYMSHPAVTIKLNPVTLPNAQIHQGKMH